MTLVQGAHAGPTPQVWFGSRIEVEDFRDLFQAHAPWQQAAAAIAVIDEPSHKLLDPGLVNRYVRWTHAHRGAE